MRRVMRWGMGSGPWAGLDIGAYSVKLVALQPGATRGRCAEALIPRGATGGEPPSAAVLAGLVDDCMARIEQSPRSFRGISVGVSGPDVIVKQLSLPLMDDAEVAGALRYEARKHLPFDVDSLVLDHQVLARNFAERKLDVLLATVSQHRLDLALAPLRELGVEAGIVDAAPLALANALGVAGARESSDSDARLLLDIGHKGSWLTLRQPGQPFFARRLDWGGAHLAQAVASALDVPLERAEAWKAEPGASLAHDGPEAVAARQAVAVLGEELRRSLAFYRTQALLPEGFTLRLAGGAARLPGLPDRLGEFLGLPVVTFSPLDAHERGGRPAAGGPQYAQAYGLALRAA